MISHQHQPCPGVVEIFSGNAIIRTKRSKSKCSGRDLRRMCRVPARPAMASETGELAPSIGWHCDHGNDDDDVMMMVLKIQIFCHFDENFGLKLH